VSPRRWRALRLAAVAVATLAIVAALGGSWVAYTDAGARWGFERLGALLPGELQIADLKGPLRSPLSVRDLTYRNENVEITAQRLALRWRLPKLWTRRLDIAELTADSVRVVFARRPGTIHESGDTAVVPLPDLDLPVHILMRDVHLKHVELWRQGEPGRFAAGQVRLQSLAFEDTFGLRRAILHSPELDIDVWGTVLPRRDYPLALDAEWTWRPPGRETVSGAGRLTGTLERFDIDQRLRAPFPAHLTGTVVSLRRRAHLDGVLTFEDLDPRTIDPGWPAVVMSGSARVRGRRDRFALDGDLRARTAGTPLIASFALDRDPARWRIERLALRIPGRSGAAVIHGTIVPGDGADGGGTPRLDLEARWRDLRWPMPSARGTARARGSTERYALDVDAALAPADLPAGRWRLRGQGDRRSARFHSVAATWLGGSLAGRGQVAWTPQWSWNLDAQGRDLDPGTVWKGWPGSLALRAHYAGRATTGGTVGRLDLEEVRGTVRQRPAAGFARLRFDGPASMVDSLSLGVESAHLSAAGRLEPTWDLGWRLDVPHLGVLVDGGAGSLAAAGRLTGPNATPRIQGDVSAESLLAGRMSAGTITARADVTTGGHGPVEADLSATDLWLDQRTLTRVHATARGRTDAHQLTASLAGVSDTLGVALNGALDEGAWRGVLSRLDLHSGGIGDWGLERPASLHGTRHELAVRDMCWRSGPSRACGSGSWQPAGGWNVDARLDSVHLAVLEPLVPGDLDLQGPLDGIVVGRADAAGRITGRAALIGGPGTMSYAAEGGNRVTAPLERSTVDAVANGAGLQARGRIAVTQVGTVEGDLGLPGLRLGRGGSHGQPVRGALRLRIEDLGPLQAFTPELDGTRGRLHADLALAGTTSRPAVTGNASLTGGHAKVSRLGIVVDDIAIEADRAGQDRMTLKGSARSGKGEIQFEGSAAPAEIGGEVASLDVHGSRFEAVHTNQLQAVVSPDLHLAATRDRIDLTGTLHVPSARFVQYGAQNPVVPPSGDVVVTRAERDTVRKPRVYSRVYVSLGDDIHVRAHALEARPTGGVLVLDEPGKPPRARGELRIQEGHYRAYGQDLKIERGRLIYAGSPMVNPSLDIRAARTALDATVAGVEVRGTLNDPELELWSYPPLAQDEIASYVLTGRSLREAGSAEQRVLEEFAQAYALRKGNILSSRVADALGVDEVRFEAEGDLSDSRVLVGTYPTARLHLLYGLGVLKAEPAVRLRYILNPRWTVEAEAENDNRVDLLYTIERGKR
jgi:translocation and assembly module TamB